MQTGCPERLTQIENEPLSLVHVYWIFPSLWGFMYSAVYRPVQYWNRNMSIPLLLMSWLLSSPGHQQQWYRLCRINGPLSSMKVFYHLEMRNIVFCFLKWTPHHKGYPTAPNGKVTILPGCIVLHRFMANGAKLVYGTNKLVVARNTAVRNPSTTKKSTAYWPLGLSRTYFV